MLGSLRERLEKNDPIEYFLPTEVRNTFSVPEGAMEIEVPQNEEISGGGKNGVEGFGSTIRRRANRGNINIKERD